MEYEVENLVTGGTGFIGSHLVRLLLSKGEEVAVVSRRGDKGLNLADVNDANLKLVKADLLNSESLEHNLPKARYVYHLAGLVRTGQAYRKKVFDINYHATCNLFRILKDKKPERIVYLASIFALGKGTETRPATEDTPYNLENYAKVIPYFAAKREAQIFVEEHVKKGMPVVFVYPCFCLGPGDIYLSSSALVYFFIKGLVKVWWEGGINVMDARDAAVGLYLGMKNGEVGEKYIIGGKNVTFRDLFRELSQLTGKREPRLKIPKSLIRGGGTVLENILGIRTPLDRGTALVMTDYWYYSWEKARKNLGYQPRPIEETLRDSVQWFREHEKDVVRR